MFRILPGLSGLSRIVDSRMNITALAFQQNYLDVVFAKSTVILFEKFFFKFPFKAVSIPSRCGSVSINASTDAWNGSWAKLQASLQVSLCLNKTIKIYGILCERQRCR